MLTAGALQQSGSVRSPFRGLSVAISVSLGLHAALGLGTNSPSVNSTFAAAVPQRIEIRLAPVAAQPTWVGGVTAGAGLSSDDAPLPPVHVTQEIGEAVETLEAKFEPMPAAQSEPTVRPRPANLAADPAYFPRSSLTQPPVPLTEVVLNWPDSLIPVGRLAGVFWLYIGETGVVDHIQTDDSTLSPQLEEIAKSAFLSARFEAGQLEGRGVKSLIKIEVVFDNRPSSMPTATVALERAL